MEDTELEYRDEVLLVEVDGFRRSAGVERSILLLCLLLYLCMYLCMYLSINWWGLEASFATDAAGGI